MVKWPTLEVGIPEWVRISPKPRFDPGGRVGWVMVDDVVAREWGGGLVDGGGMVVEEDAAVAKGNVPKGAIDANPF